MEELASSSMEERNEEICCLRESSVDSRASTLRGVSEALFTLSCSTEVLASSRTALASERLDSGEEEEEEGDKEERRRSQWETRSERERSWRWWRCC